MRVYQFCRFGFKVRSSPHHISWIDTKETFKLDQYSLTRLRYADKCKTNFEKYRFLHILFCCKNCLGKLRARGKSDPRHCCEPEYDKTRE